MKLHQLTVKNFRAIKDLDLSFEDGLGRVRPITVLAGPNGCGKTSVLYSIIHALRGPLGYRPDDVPKPTDLDIHRAGGSGGLSPKPIKITTSLDLEFGQAELKAIETVFKDTSELHRERLSQIPTGEARVRLEWSYPPEKKSDGTQEPYWYVKTKPWEALNWFHGRKFAIRGWRSRKLSNRNLLGEIGGIFLFPQDRSLRQRVVGTESAISQYPNIDEIAFEFQEKSGGEQHSPSVSDILQYLGSYARNQAVRAEDNWELRIQQQFERVCRPKKYLGYMYQPDDPVGAPYFQDGNSQYPLSTAASGEQVIIEYITRLTYPSPWNHSIILIDEPEVHLHPGWIRQLYQALPQIGEDNQYILATHSQELRSLAAQDNSLIDMGEMVPAA